MLNKAGDWHMKQLIQDCIKEMMNASMYDNQQIDNPYLTDNTLDLMIEHLDPSYFKDKKYRSLELKFDSVVRYWVQIRLGRILNFESDEHDKMMESIDKVRPYFMKTEAGVVQKLKQK
jgi:hypothetical protein